MAEPYALTGSSFTEKNNPYTGRATTIILEQVRIGVTDGITDNEICRHIYMNIKRSMGACVIEEWSPEELSFIAGAIAMQRHEAARVPNGS